MKNNFLKISICLSLLCIVLIQSCKVGQKYSRPEVKLPDEFRGETYNNFGDTTNLGRVNWKDFFQDTILKALIDSALANNYDMKTALINMDIADKQLRQNKLNYLPELDATIASGERQWASKEYSSSASSKYYNQKGSEAPKNGYVLASRFGSEVAFSWEIDIWGKISNSRDQLMAGYLNTQEAKHAIQTDLIAQVANGYFNLLMLDAQIEVAKRNVQLNDSTLNMIKLQYQAGEITALAIQQTESQRLVALSLVPELEKEIIVQENALRILTGELPADIVRAGDLDKLFRADEDISLGSPIEIIRNRPDIRSAEFELMAANANANIQQAMRYPSLTLGGALGVNAMLPKNWFNIPGALLGNIGADLTAPIFKNRKLKTEYEIAKLERDKSEIAFQQKVLEAVGEVSNSVVTVAKQREQLEYAKKRVDNSQLAVKNAGLLFRSGYATYLEVITAQSDALSSDLDLVALRQQYLVSYIDLYRALGGGWE